MHSKESVSILSLKYEPIRSKIEIFKNSMNFHPRPLNFPPKKISTLQRVSLTPPEKKPQHLCYHGQVYQAKDFYLQYQSQSFYLTILSTQIIINLIEICATQNHFPDDKLELLMYLLLTSFIVVKLAYHITQCKILKYQAITP